MGVQRTYDLGRDVTGDQQLGISSMTPSTLQVLWFCSPGSDVDLVTYLLSLCRIYQ
jgi:hypothetical protein